MELIEWLAPSCEEELEITDDPTIHTEYDKDCETTNESNVSSNSNASSLIGVADEIKKFKELLDCEAITREEYEAKKKQLLGL